MLHLILDNIIVILLAAAVIAAIIVGKKLWRLPAKSSSPASSMPPSRQAKMSMDDEAICISRAGQELGTWGTADVARMLEAGALKPGDCFWREGMVEWSTLDRFAPPAPETKTYAVTFGGAATVDKIGFVRAGEIKLTADDAIELIGRKRWPAIARVGTFLIAAPLFWFVLGSILDALPREGGSIFFLFRAGFGLFTLIGTPFLVLTLIHYFCVSPGNVRVERSAISEVARKGAELSFLARLPSG